MGVRVDGPATSPSGSIAVEQGNGTGGNGAPVEMEDSTVNQTNEEDNEYEAEATRNEGDAPKEAADDTNADETAEDQIEKDSSTALTMMIAGVPEPAEKANVETQEAETQNGDVSQPAEELNVPKDDSTVDKENTDSLDNTQETLTMVSNTQTQETLTMVPKTQTQET